MSLTRRKQLLELSSELGLPIIEDDPYSLTSFDGTVIPTLKSMDATGTVLYISSLSKIVASGLRIGWIIGPKRVIERLADAKQQVDFGHSIFPQWIAHHFLQSSQFHLHITSLQWELKKRRDAIVASLRHTLGNRVSYHAPKGGIHLWCRLNEDVTPTRLLEESLTKGLAFLPGSVMGTQKNYVRFTFGRGETSEIEKGIARFADALNSLSES
jgi:DNA-binding transcriptional MocR family regulator